MANGEHTAERPDWNCRVCGNPWPCAPAKVELSEDYQRFPSSLVIYLAAHLTDAIDDLAAGSGGIPPTSTADSSAGPANERWAR